MVDSGVDWADWEALGSTTNTAARTNVTTTITATTDTIRTFLLLGLGDGPGTDA